MAERGRVPYEIYIISSHSVLSTGDHAMSVPFIALDKKELVPGNRTRSLMFAEYKIAGSHE
jgi:hypothetical protein